MKMTKKLVLAAAALPLMLGTASAFAYGGGDKGDHKGMHGKCGGFDKHSLTLPMIGIQHRVGFNIGLSNDMRWTRPAHTQRLCGE